MGTDVDLIELVGRRADEQLLAGRPDELPDDVGRPPEIPQDPRRGAVVAFGATMTGVTLVAGLVLLVLGLIGLLGGGPGETGLVELVAGALLVGTHWGWVHVAELTANHLQAAHDRGPLSAREGWLAAIEPYPRWSVTTTVEDDGSIRIEQTCHRPVPASGGRFTFVRDVVTRELHDPEEPGAAVAERAELLRREAHLATDRARRRYDAAISAREAAALAEEDRREQAIAERSASQALSDQINRNLREPPLLP